MRRRPIPPRAARIFTHLEGCGEDRWFSRVAHAMTRSPWWSTVPVRDEPRAVSGEVRR